MSKNAFDDDAYLAEVYAFLSGFPWPPMGKDDEEAVADVGAEESVPELLDSVDREVEKLVKKITD